MSGPRMSNMGQMNGNRRPNISRMNLHDSRSYHDHRQQSHHDRQVSSHHDNRHQHIQQPINTQHEDLIKYIYESWSKIEMDRSSSTYYQDHENNLLKDFRPFDLEAYWGRRLHQNHQQHPNHHHYPQHSNHHQHQNHHQQHHS